jgi:hypothetical protein
VRNKRQRIAKSFGDDFIVYLVDDTPTSITEAYTSLDADDWKEAVHSEMDSILSNGTWELSELPFGCKLIVISGCSKISLGLTVLLTSTRLDLWLRVILKRKAKISLILIHLLDVKTTFLNGELDEEIYMDQPDRFVVKGEEQKVCKLLKSMYDLKQAPK